MITTYQAAQTYLNQQLPMFQKIGKQAFKNDLTNIKSLCKHLKQPQTKYPTIHIAGTNGKGSVAHILAALFQTKGLKVGLFTSPHYRDFRERIKINGSYIPKTEIISFINEYHSIIEALQPSFFEVTVALAFHHFAQEKVDIAIIETGLGGRLDATNIITPILSIITNISFDHQNILGNTLEKIAIEKAGIIKPMISVVIGETNVVTQPVFLEVAKKNKSRIYFADANLMVVALERDFNKTVFEVRGMTHQNLLYQNLALGLIGTYQSQNLITVLQAIQVLETLNWSFSEKEIADALYNVKKLTNMIGRWDILQYNPLTITDSGHNEAGIKAIVQQLQTLKYDNLHIIFGMVRRNNLENILKLLPKDALYYFVKPNLPRGLNANELKEQTTMFNLTVEVYDSVQEAYHSAQLDASPQDVIFIGGSSYVVAEILGDFLIKKPSF